MAKSKDQFRHAKEIFRPYGEIDRILDWCRQELTEDWRWQLISASSYSNPGRYIFYFNGDKDYFTFTLKWS